ncbi:hypothetical protein [Serratia grimesii]|uniref:hypothetical protein n=1 Tax=Serratia grimesii TaxID=82995 RepID=UPI00217ABA7A|nr:hypothetical protein [Serratia grimesii]CAI1094196.1 Uncharacterised protein [Serratia grimesii]
MMDNKLSELSKPVAFIESAEKLKAEAGFAVTVQPIKRWGADIPLYSQEYVSALLAELEAKDKTLELEREKSRRVMSENNMQAERIAELNAELASLKNEFGELWKGNVDLLAKLATPVRLKKADSSSAPITRHSFNAAVNYCAEAIRAAGFTFTVEGDEQ